MKLGIAEMYLKGKADIWFHGFISNHPNTDWGMFSKEICKKNMAEEVMETFSKLRQGGTITEY